MKAPDKIYLDEDMIRYHVLDEKLNESDIEYIRKDALVEMLKGYSHPLTRVVVEGLIDKINEL